MSDVQNDESSRINNPIIMYSIKQLKNTILANQKLLKYFYRNNAFNEKELDSFLYGFNNILELFYHDKKYDIDKIYTFIDEMYTIKYILHSSENFKKIFKIFETLISGGNDIEFNTKSIEIFFHILINGKILIKDFEDFRSKEFKSKFYTIYEAKKNLVQMDSNINSEFSYIHPTYLGCILLYSICNIITKNEYNFNVIKMELEKKVPICCPTIGSEKKEDTKIVGIILGIYVEDINCYTIPGINYLNYDFNLNLYHNIKKMEKSLNYIFFKSENKLKLILDCIIPPELGTYRELHVCNIDVDSTLVEDVNRMSWKLYGKSPAKINDVKFFTYDDILSNEKNWDMYGQIGEQLKGYIMFKFVKYFIDIGKEDIIEEYLEEWNSKGLKINTLKIILEKNQDRFNTTTQIFKMMSKYLKDNENLTYRFT